MSVRDKGYLDYGIDEKELQRLILLCRSVEFKNKLMLLECCYEVNEEIGDYMFFSLSQGISYEKIDYIQDIPIPKVDFYGYRRKALARLKAKLEDEKHGNVGA